MSARRSKGADLASIHWIAGGAYLGPELYEELDRDLGVRPFQGYGLTEALIVTASRWEANRPGTLGVPIFADSEIVALDEDGEPVPRGEVGEVAIRAPTVMTGYIGRPEETARFLRDGWLRTGDLGCVDGDGFLHFAGRRRRFAKVAGFMVDLREVEQAIRAHPAIETCAASSEPDDLADELVRAAVTLRPGAELALAEIVEHCKRRLAFYKVPKGFRFLKSQRLSGENRAVAPPAQASLETPRPA
jgi:long-chain acyl-CoA synthetase